MIRSEKIDLLVGALIKVQSEINNPIKNQSARIPTKRGGEYEIKYADLPSILDMVRPILSKNDIFLTQTIIEKDKKTLYTSLVHSSGQMIESEIAMPSDKTTMELGGVITYLRRYALTAILGIAADEDKDALFDFGHTPKGSAVGAAIMATIEQNKQKEK